MRVRVAYKLRKHIHERDIWVVTVYNNPSDIMEHGVRERSIIRKEIFTKKAKNKDFIIRDIMEVVELSQSQLTLDEHKEQYNRKVQGDRATTP